jgi:hypothetical protein
MTSEIPSRYHVLRSLGCDPITAVAIAALNTAFGVRRGMIVFLNIEIEYE